jgi:hypothetical protein
MGYKLLLGPLLHKVWATDKQNLFRPGQAVRLQKKSYFVVNIFSFRSLLLTALCNRKSVNEISIANKASGMFQALEHKR